jgi:hypothetical protein
MNKQTRNKHETNTLKHATNTRLFAGGAGGANKVYFSGGANTVHFAGGANTVHFAGGA